jgi:hypothetical protein
MHNRPARLAARNTPRITVAAIATCLLLAACGGREQPAPSFAPLDFSYLPKLRLNVATMTVEDHAAQGAGQNDLGPTAPVPPDQALQHMARDRLVAAGNSGSGVFTIDQASITGTGGGALDGHIAVHLDILTANGGHAGYAEAHVSRQFVPGTAAPDDGTRAELDDLTRQMMQDMNVELEYQVRRSLREWLVDASGAPVAGSVEQQTLAPPGASGATATTPGTGTSVGATPLGATRLAPAAAPVSGLPTSGPVNLAPQPAAPGTALPEGGSAPPVQERSPPPNFLQPPSATSPASPPTTGSGY